MKKRQLKKPVGFKEISKAMSKEQELVTVKLTKLIGKNVNGVLAQIVNPNYLVPDESGFRDFPKWRKLVKVTKYKEKGKDWVEGRWEREIGDTCNFKGCTIESDHCELQFKKEDYKNIK